MIVVADTSAISNLLTIGHEWILRDLFGTVIVPPAVESELRAWHPDLPSFISIKSPEKPGLLPELAQVLDHGEIEAISLALEIHADLLLIDERKGRAEAQRLGLKITGLLGVLLEAKKTGLLEQLSPVLDALIEIADFRISAAVKAGVLELAGE
jgi:predicted nucleic acid-binding protein